MSSLDWYLTDASALLHDQNYLFTSQQQLTRWINLGRREIARRTGCLQRLISGQSAFGASAQAGSMIPGAIQPGALPGAAPGASFSAPQNTFQTIPFVERYPYIGFANPYVQSANQGIKGVNDVLSVSISWGGSMRPSLNWMPWDEFQAYCRAYATLVTSYPAVWSTFNDGEAGEVWLFPVPSFQMEMEWQTFCVPTDLNTDSDFDSIPEGFKNAVKWYAAGMAYFTSQRYENAGLMSDRFLDAIGVARVAADGGKSRAYYPTVF
jgi:hypothetical protein